MADFPLVLFIIDKKQKNFYYIGRKEEFEGETIRVSTLIKIKHQIKRTPYGVLFIWCG